MKGRIWLATTAAAGCFAIALVTTTGAIARALPSDSAAPLGGAQQLGAALATPLFLPGEVDLSTLGVASSQLANTGLVGAQSSSAGNGPNMFIVDDDHAQCPNAQFTRIQDAVDLAPPGAQIKVCPGTYVEQVRITKNDQTLLSQVPLQAVIQAPAVMLQYPNSIVTIDGATGVSIRQFTITGPYTAVQPGGCAGLTDRHTGVRVVNGSATIYGNHITKIRDADPLLFGCQDGIAVLVGRQFEAQVGSAVLRNNLIDMYQKGGVVVDNAGSYAWITQNEITGEGPTDVTGQNGVQVGRGASADVDHNSISRNRYLHLVFDFTAAGVLLFETDAHVSTDHNDVFQNGVGIDVDEGTVGLTIAHNDVHENFDDGIAAFEDATNNLIAYNKSFNNTPFDCYDDTVGPYGPSGTANNWLHDMGLIQNRPGLCKQP